MNLNIPLSGYYESIRGFYHNNAYNITNLDILEGYRVLGYKSGNSFENPSLQYTVALDIPIPIKPSALNSAYLSFSFLSGIPPVLDTEAQQFVANWREIELEKFPTFSNVRIGIDTTTTFTSLSNYDILLDSILYSGMSFILNHSTIPSLNITPLLKYHTTQTNWKKNNYVSIILSGIPSGLGGGGAMDLTSLYLQLTYQAIPPNEPTLVSAIESAYKQVSISWTQPTDNGDANITKYIIQSGAPSGIAGRVSEWYNIAESTTTTVEIDNLPTDVNIKFRVAAQNSAGIGSYSLPTEALVLSKNLAPVTALSFNDSNYTRIRVRRANSGEWQTFNPVLAIGEIAYELDTYRLKIGNGISYWTGLPYVNFDQSTINFPAPPDTILRIASSENDAGNSDRVILNLSQNNRLNIIGKEGVTVNYDDNYNKLIFSTDKLYNPINFGTIYNPTTSGTPGSLLYDNSWLYFCVANNYWHRSPIDKQWVDFATMTVSKSGNNYVSYTSLLFSGIFIKIDTNGDPYPALAGRPLTNIDFRDFIENTIKNQNLSLLFRYRGGSNTSHPMVIDSTDIHGIAFNGVSIKSMSAGTGSLPGFVPAPTGFTFNAIYHKEKFYSDLCGGYPNSDGLYSYRDGTFLKNCWNLSDVYYSNPYYSGSHYSGDFFRHTDGHSKMIGFCLDGYPIYGPYAYSGNLDNSSNIILMKSSYSGLSTDDHRPTDWKYINKIGVNDIEYDLFKGTFIEDFVYISGLGTLDEYNGRFCITPEFPSGTYAYFLTFTNESLSIPEFPYIFGTGTLEQRA